MSAKRAARVVKPKSQREKWTLFVSTFICQLCAGHLYWFASLGQGLTTHLSLTESQLTVVLTALNAGSMLAFMGGLLYSRIGARRTACLGAALGSLSYATLGLLVHMRATNAFIVVIALALCIVLSTSFVYSSVITIAAAQFRKEHRGRAMAFQSAMYAMSSGVIALLQSAFFPSADDTEYLLYFVTALVSLPFFIAFFLFPNDDLSELLSEDESASDCTPLLSIPIHHERRNSAVRVTLSTNEPRRTWSDDDLMRVAYLVALVIVANLQLGAVATWMRDSRLRIPASLVTALPWLPPTVHAEVVFAFFLILLLCSLLLIPLACSEVIDASRSHPLANPEDPLGGESSPESFQMSLSEVLRDFRFQLLVVLFFVIPGSSTTTTFVQISAVAASRLFRGFRNEIIPAAVATGNTVAGVVQAIIVAFSSCDLLSRLVAGAIADMGSSAKQRESWKLRLIEADAVLMALAVLGVAFAPEWALIVVIGLVGYAHGTFFAIVPALCSNWFGIDRFPITFNVAASGITVASLSMSSWIPKLLSDIEMSNNWVEVVPYIGATQTQRFCNGTMCFAPTFTIVSAMCTSLFILLLMVHKRIVSMA